jgi:hypothetical protein
VTGLSFIDTVLVSKKIDQITRESEAKLKTQGDVPPDEKAVSKAQLRRDPLNNLIQVNPKEPGTQQVRYVVRQQLVYSWLFQTEYNKHPEHPSTASKIVYWSRWIIGLRLDIYLQSFSRCYLFDG